MVIIRILTNNIKFEIRPLKRPGAFLITYGYILFWFFDFPKVYVK